MITKELDVLILIVVDNGLVLNQIATINDVSLVLILIVVDNGLVRMGRKTPHPSRGWS